MAPPAASPPRLLPTLGFHGDAPIRQSTVCQRPSPPSAASLRARSGDSQSRAVYSRDAHLLPASLGCFQGRRHQMTRRGVADLACAGRPAALGGEPPGPRLGRGHLGGSPTSRVKADEP